MPGSLEKSLSEPLRVSLSGIWRKYALKWLSSHDWQLVGFMWILSAALGYAGFVDYYASINEKHSCWDFLYVTTQLFVLQSGWVLGAVNWKLELARFLAPAATVYTALIAMALLFRDQTQVLRARLVSNHVVICGLGKKGFLLALRFLDREESVVVVERDPANDLINLCREQGGIVLIGDASDQDTLRRAGVIRADYLIAVCGDEGLNAEIAVDSRDLVSRRQGTPLKCVVQIENVELCRLLKGHELGMSKVDSFRLEFFNSYLLGARALLDKHAPFDKDLERIPHILVIGVGRLGESLVAGVARSWRSQYLSRGARLRVTLLDANAEEQKKLLMLRNPFLERICEVNCIQMDVRSSQFLAGDFLLDESGYCQVTRIYICLDNDSVGMATALALLKRLRGREVPIVVRMSRDGGIATLLDAADETREGFGSLSVFGLLERTCAPDLVLGGTHEVLAQAICQYWLDQHTDTTATSALRSAPDDWSALPEDMKRSFRRQADQIGLMLRAVGCTVEPLSDLDAEAFQFSQREKELLARSIHEFHVREHESDSLAFLPIAGNIDASSPAGHPSWDLCSEVLKGSYRDMVTRLPEFLARVDFQIYRLR